MCQTAPVFDGSASLEGYWSGALQDAPLLECAFFLMLRCGLWILGGKTRGKGHSLRTVSTVHVGRDPLREVLARFLYRKVTLCPLSVL